ncbi:uncharacterized protein EAE98_004284 [Botrytis deweyae]|uniref:Transcription factor domain-containing protein n=1 Tax=Botrytis deweyae TaxID=2478750 RepID=A0ABQ7IQF3_9HELO|nr:uncharacterized protein EAE98_004284 [Botrytis deweyae]KAF7931548.1 hypothetical protein EAE98_004284 [Botrytis deweyae]
MITLDDRSTLYGLAATGSRPQIDGNSPDARDTTDVSKREDEELVTVPVAKLQQLVEFGIQVLKESRRKTNIREIDLEYNAAPAPEGFPVIRSYQARSEVPRPLNRPKYLHEFLTRACANPWPVRKVEVNRNQVIHLDHLGQPFDRFNRVHFEAIWENHFRIFFGYGERSVTASEIVRRGWFWKRILNECDKEMIPWLLEIGTDNPDARAAILVKILICIIKSSIERRYSTTSTIGAILERCYTSGVLRQPEDFPSNPNSIHFQKEMRQDYSFHIILVAISLNIYNDCLMEDNSDLGLNSRQILWSPMDLLREACGGANLEQILAFQGPELVVSILSVSKSSNAPVLLESPTTSSGRIDDLNIGSLQTIGDLRIVWTDIFEEHLLLNHENKCLKIARLRPFVWGMLSIFQNDCVRWSSIYRQPRELSILKELKADIEKTWAILFSITTLGENSKNKSRVREKLKHEYETIMDEDRNPIHTDIQTLKEYHMPWIEDDSATGRVQSYYESRWENLQGIIKSKQDKSTIAYSNFGMFEDRVRDLRQYMDHQRPHGLRQLLRDSRDALNYYTFMGVIIFGLLTVFLALASFFVGVAQTYAAFKALDASS